MTTKRELAFEATRARILESAMGLFREKGFDGTTMRDVAAAADVALGAAYHYFKSKDDIVMVFYRTLMDEESAWLEDPQLKTMEKLEERVRFVITRKLDQLAQHRLALEGVFRKALDPKSPLSPFSQETRLIREGNITFLTRVIADSRHSIHDEVKPALPRLLWLYQMAIILTWFYDRSPDQTRSRQLLTMSLPLLLQSLSALSLPLMGGLRRSVITLLDTLDGILEEPKS